MSDYYEGNSDYAFDKYLEFEENLIELNNVDIKYVAKYINNFSEHIDMRFKDMNVNIANKILNNEKITERQEKAIRNCFRIIYVEE